MLLGISTSCHCCLFWLCLLSSHLCHSVNVLSDSLSRIRSASSWYRECYKVQDRLDNLSTGPSAVENLASRWRRCSALGGSACTRWFSSWSVWACPGNSSSHLWPSPAGAVKNKTVSLVKKTRQMFLCLGLLKQTETDIEQFLQSYFHQSQTGIIYLLGWYMNRHHVRAWTRPFHIFKKCFQIPMCQC